jgi:hypothetical protein
VARGQGAWAGWGYAVGPLTTLTDKTGRFRLPHVPQGPAVLSVRNHNGDFHGLFPHRNIMLAAGRKIRVHGAQIQPVGVIRLRASLGLITSASTAPKERRSTQSTPAGTSPQHLPAWRFRPTSVTVFTLC